MAANEKPGPLPEVKKAGAPAAFVRGMSALIALDLAVVAGVLQYGQPLSAAARGTVIVALLSALLAVACHFIEWVSVERARWFDDLSARKWAKAHMTVAGISAGMATLAIVYAVQVVLH